MRIILKIRLEGVTNEVDVLRLCRSEDAKPKYHVYGLFSYDLEYDSIHYSSMPTKIKCIKRLVQLNDDDIIFPIAPSRYYVTDNYIMIRSTKNGVQYDKVVLINPGKHQLIQDETPTGRLVITNIKEHGCDNSPINKKRNGNLYAMLS